MCRLFLSKMLWKLSFTALVLICLPTLMRAEPKCHMIEMERCFEKLHHLKEANHDPSHLLTSMDGLNRICRTVKVDFVGCIQAYLNKCGTPLHKELSKTLSEAILEHMDEICSPNSAFREDIVSISPCLHDKVLSQKSFQAQCNNPFFTTVAWGEMNAHSDHPERARMDYIVDTGCCAYRRWEECTMPLIGDKCHSKGQKVLATVLAKLWGGVPDFMCSKALFKPNSKICAALPDLDEQRSQVNLTRHEDQKFSLFALLKLFLVRDVSSA